MANKADTPPAAETIIIDEQARVEERRYQEARQAGIEHLEACIFSVGGEDIGVLRQLVRDGCPPRLLAKILI